MTEKGKFFQKLWEGTCYFFNPKNSPYLRDINEELDKAIARAKRSKAKKGDWDMVDYIRWKADMRRIGTRIIFPPLGILLFCCEVFCLVEHFKEVAEPKVEYVNNVDYVDKIGHVDKVDKNLKKFKNPLEKLDAQDLVLEHYFYPPKKKEENPFVMKGKVPEERPFIVGMNQKIRE